MLRAYSNLIAGKIEEDTNVMCIHKQEVAVYFCYYKNAGENCNTVPRGCHPQYKDSSEDQYVLQNTKMIRLNLRTICQDFIKIVFFLWPLGFTGFISFTVTNSVFCLLLYSETLIQNQDYDFGFKLIIFGQAIAQPRNYSSKNNDFKFKIY